MPLPDSRWQSLPDRTHSIAWLIAGFTVLRLLLAATAPLLPQEAYYWSWSRHLDWSYFDHPPLATYSMVLTTALFGQSIFGIKSAAVLWALGWNLLWVRLILDMYGDRRLAFWSIAALNLTFVYEAFGLGPTPDSPLIFAWTGALRKRGELDGTPALTAFADKLEAACLQTVEDGVMTGDLALLCERKDVQKVNSKDFIAAIRERLEKSL